MVIDCYYRKSLFVIVSVYGTESHIIKVAGRCTGDARPAGRAAETLAGINSRAGHQGVLQAAREHGRQASEDD